MTAEQGATIPAEIELSGQIVRPGDTLIILHKGDVSAAMAEAIKDRARRLIPGLADVVVIAADGLAVYRPSA